MAKILVLFSILLVNACTHQPGPSLQIQTGEQLPELAAEFETVITASDGNENVQIQRYRWRFWRAAKRIETRNLGDNSGEVWEKSANGDIAYTQVFHDQKQAIDYLPGDLSAIGAELDWTALATLVNKGMLSGLVADDQENVLGHVARHYQRNDPEKPLEITWLEDEQIPAMIKRTEQGHTLITRMTAVYSLTQASWPYNRATEYRHTDFADLGDKENDPIIQSVAQKNRFRPLSH